ncbi:unnamed protein product [Closterium sp. Naga37s-1]|nr:unnamed protein product [Closterium sp. Naga37s-1]
MGQARGNVGEGGLGIEFRGTAAAVVHLRENLGTVADHLMHQLGTVTEHLEGHLNTVVGHLRDPSGYEGGGPWYKAYFTDIWVQSVSGSEGLCSRLISTKRLPDVSAVSTNIPHSLALLTFTSSTRFSPMLDSHPPTVSLSGGGRASSDSSIAMPNTHTLSSHLVHLLLPHASSLLHCAAVYLHVVAYNAAAIRFYRSLRFCFRRRLSRFYYLEGGEYDALLFARYVNGWSPPDSRCGAVRFPGVCCLAGCKACENVVFVCSAFVPPCVCTRVCTALNPTLPIRFYRSLRFCYRRRLSRFYYLEGGEYDALLFARYVNGWSPPDSSCKGRLSSYCSLHSQQLLLQCLLSCP